MGDRFIVELKNVSKSFQSNRVINKVNFKLKTGDKKALIGFNGAGKSSLLRIILGIISQDSGCVSLFDKSQNHLKFDKSIFHKVGYLPENLPLLESMKVSEYFKYLEILKSINLKMFNQLIDKFELNKFFNKRISKLSKGQKQIVAFVQTFMNDPELIVLDEPIANLDPHMILKVRNFLNELNESKTLLISTHRLDEVSRICSSFSFMNNGSLEELDVSKENVLSFSFSKNLKSLQSFPLTFEVRKLSSQSISLSFLSPSDRKKAVTLLEDYFDDIQNISLENLIFQDFFQSYFSTKREA